MADIAKIMNMLDWHVSPEIQAKGRELAKGVESIVPFLQPSTPEYNKNIWENCALILSNRSDEELTPHLVQLLEWLQDMNWPGAFCIFSRLQKYSDDKALHGTISLCIEDAKRRADEIWETNLNELILSRRSNELSREVT